MATAPAAAAATNRRSSERERNCLEMIDFDIEKDDIIVPGRTREVCLCVRRRRRRSSDRRPSKRGTLMKGPVLYIVKGGKGIRSGTALHDRHISMKLMLG